MNATQLPEAVVTPRRRRWSWMWLLPIAALLVAGVLVWQAYTERGHEVAVVFKDGHGIKSGDPIKFRGITVGAVRDVELADDLSTITVYLALRPESKHLAREGSRWWIVRPQIALHAVGGLDTLIGARQIGVLPGDGEPTNTFVGSERVPVLERIEPAGLELLLEAPRAGSLRPNMPITYRQMPIGTVTSVELASDARAVNVGVYIRPAYHALITDETKFWRQSGLNFDVGLKGFSFHAESLQTLLTGGIALATPDEAGPPVNDGHRFILHDEPTDAWLQWQPSAPIGEAVGSGNAGASIGLPQPIELTLHWTQPRLKFFDNEESRSGLGIMIDQTVYLPTSLARAPTVAEDGTARMVIPALAGARKQVSNHLASGLTTLNVGGIPPDAPRWPRSAVRVPKTVEDVLIVDATGRTITIAATRLTINDGSDWLIDESVGNLPPVGAPAVARSDGKLIGLLLKNPARVVPLPMRSNARDGVPVNER